MKIETVNTHSLLYEGLQHFIEKHGLVFNSEKWLANYPAAQVHQAVIANNNNETIGCFIYFRFKRAVYKFAITPPFSPDVELFYVNPAESVVGRHSFSKELLAAVAAYFDAQGLHYINLNLPRHIIDTQPFIWKNYVSRNRYSYLVELSRSKDELWDNLSSEKRKSLNKATKDALEITETTDYRLVYSLVVKSLERNDKDRNLEILQNILFSFANQHNSYAFIASHKGEPIGATFCVIDRTRAVYLFGGFDAENKHHGAGVSCMWQSILKAKALNLNYFDFEGSMNATIERYFREFGGQLTPYFCVEKIKPGLKLLLKLKKHNPL